MAVKNEFVLIGREEEVARLDRIVQSKSPEFLAVYGRRRVGKTYLIRQHLANHIVFDITGIKDISASLQLAHFHQALIKWFGSRKAKEIPANWIDAFARLATCIKSLPRSARKKVLFIDEMPWMDTPRSGFLSGLEYFWNSHASNMPQVLLIACGSASSWMLKKLIRNRGGLYNRITQRIHLQPFTLHEVQAFLQSRNVKLNHYQLIEIYMAMGGIPHYLKEVRPGKSAQQVIQSVCFSRQGLLYDEYNQLYDSLFAHAEQHIAIVEALARHPQGLTRKALAQYTRLPEGTLSRTLQELEQCDFIMKQLPIFRKKKESIYLLIDFYSLFYLRFIKPNQKNAKDTWPQIRNHPSYTAWSGYAYEKICMLHTDAIKTALGIKGIYTQTGSWVQQAQAGQAGAQVDMVLKRADGFTHLCEVKFTSEAFIANKKFADAIRLRTALFRQHLKGRQSVGNILLTTYPAIKNQHYLGLIDDELSMEVLFAPVALYM